jgi:hypothetical protein
MATKARNAIAEVNGAAQHTTAREFGNNGGDADQTIVTKSGIEELFRHGLLLPAQRCAQANNFSTTARLAARSMS